MIVRGSEKEISNLFIVRKPQINLISKKEALESLKKLIKAIKSLIHFSLPLTKEKSLYNITFTKALKERGGSIGTLSR